MAKISDLKVNDSTKERFWTKVAQPNENGCMDWKGATYRDGYGSFSVKRSTNLAAHRVSYVLNVDPIPDGLYVCHKCDRKICVAPAHLFLGTCKDNLQDMVKKKRHMYGEKSLKAKLKEVEVREILADTVSSNEDLGNKYGVTSSHIWGIKRRIYWKEINL